MVNTPIPAFPHKGKEEWRQKNKMENKIPRRAYLDQNTPAELAIYHAMQAVEKVGAHPLLTEAIILLGKAKDSVADYVDREQTAASDLDTKPEGGHIENSAT